MSQDRPSINDILLTVQKFLDDTGPKLEGEAKYHAQVSSYLLGICERELRLGEAIDRDGLARLSKFMKREGSLTDLTEALCSEIRAGKHDGDWDELLDLVLHQTIDKVKVVRPGNLDRMHRDQAAQ